MYYSLFDDTSIASQRATVQTICLLLQSDIDLFGLNMCLEKTMLELRNLVHQGLFDKKSNKILQVRIIASLGDNLEQNNICGLKLNFSTMMHCCRKCMCSRYHLRSVEGYGSIHAKNHVRRTDSMLKENLQESRERHLKHVNSVWKESLYQDFPFFEVTRQLPQCSSHDFLEGCVKLHLKIIIEHFVKQKWVTYEALEKLIKKFPYKGSDANSRPVLRSKKMKVKKSRKIVGTFSEVSTLIQTFPQIIFDHIQDTNNDYWKWLLCIRDHPYFM